ncbi:MAG: tetratricopeptide repeat protein [Chitinophagales bacterium]|nr:tetratricopeptide repeat protein [Chitinophagales bacterium]
MSEHTVLRGSGAKIRQLSASQRMVQPVNEQPIKKCLLLFLVIILFPGFSFAQKQGQSLIDSLLSELQTATDDTGKVNLLISLSYNYTLTDPDIALKYGNEGLQLAEKLNWKKGTANANRTIGINYCFGKSEYSKSLDYFSKALELVVEINDRSGMAKVLSNLGVVYWYQSDFPKALEYYFNALKIDEELGDKSGMARTLGNIGIVYNSREDYHKALEYMLKANDIDEELGNTGGIASNLGNIGEIYRSLADFPKALEYESRALKLCEELGDKNGIARNLGNIGAVYNDQRNYPKALEYYFNALKISKELGLKIGMATNLGDIGGTYLSIAKNNNREELNKLFAGSKTRALQQARNYTDSAITILSEIGELNTLFSNYEKLSEIQALLGDPAGALESFKMYAAIKDSVFNTEKDKKLTETAMQYEFDKKEAAAKAMQEKSYIRQRNIRNSIAAGLAGALIFLAVVYRQRNRIGKEKKKSDAEKQRSEELLLNILPAEVAEELKTTGRAKAKAFTMVTVMFTDFKDFTRVSEKVSAELLVDEIHYCFSAFDNIIQQYRIEKIKTIGDAYLCASGLPVSSYTHAIDMVKAAIEIRDFMITRKKEKEAKGEIPFELRIGIHTGPVVAGIVGLKKYAYDIWGDTVNTAARMEQNSEVGKVNISGSTYELVKERFRCEYRGKIEAKNKGVIDMYFAELS